MCFGQKTGPGNCSPGFVSNQMGSLIANAAASSDSARAPAEPKTQVSSDFSGIDVKGPLDPSLNEKNS